MRRSGVMAGMGYVRRLLGNEDGVSAIEFALLAPILIGGFLLMVDTGRAVGARMEMDRNVRAGAQAAMSLNNDMEAIERIVLASAGSPEDLEVEAKMTCSCAGAAAGCAAPCATGEAPSVFVEIGASRSFSGLLISAMTLDSGTRVRIR